jgi:hypothetical protein
MSFKLGPEPDPAESPSGGGAGASKPATTTTTTRATTTAPHSQLTGAGERSPPPGPTTPRYIDDRDIRVLNNLLDDLKKLDTYHGEEELELEVTSRRDSAAGQDLESGDGDVLLEPKGGRAEQVTYNCLTGVSVASEKVISAFFPLALQPNFGPWPPP